MMNDGGWGWGWAIVCMVAVIAIIALVAWAIISSTNGNGSHDDRETSRPDALAVLERRFADGDIDEREYRRRRDLLALPSRRGGTMHTLLEDIDLLLTPAPPDTEGLYDRVAGQYEQFRSLWVKVAGNAVERSILGILLALMTALAIVEVPC